MPALSKTKTIVSLSQTKVTAGKKRSRSDIEEKPTTQEVTPLDEKARNEFLEAFDESSSDSESEDDDAGGIPLEKLPAPPKAAASTDPSSKTAVKDDEPWVLYVGHIPHGFHEPQMRAYFSQFGTVTHCRLARNRRTGASKHYAFLKFDSSAVADVVQRTMDKYLLFGHILSVKRMPAEQIHADIWKGAGRKFKKIPWAKIEGRGLAVPRSRDVWERRVRRSEERREKLRKVCDEYGYEFTVPEVRKVGDVKSKAERERIEKGEEPLLLEAPVAESTAPAPAPAKKKTKKQTKKLGT